MAMSFNFVLSNNTPSNGSYSDSETEVGLLSNNNSGNSSILTATNDYNNGGIDAFAGKDAFGSCDLSNFNESFFANASTETVGSVAFDSSETVGSVACASAETAGSVACGGGDSGAGSCGGGSFSSVC